MLGEIGVIRFEGAVCLGDGVFVVMVASECAPVAQAGGLGDVVFGLSRELGWRGNAVEIVLAKYDCLRYDRIYGLTVDYENLTARRRATAPTIKLLREAAYHQELRHAIRPCPVGSPQGIGGETMRIPMSAFTPPGSCRSPHGCGICVGREVAATVPCDRRGAYRGAGGWC